MGSFPLVSRKQKETKLTIDHFYFLQHSNDDDASVKSCVSADDDWHRSCDGASSQIVASRDKD